MLVPDSAASGAAVDLFDLLPPEQRDETARFFRLVAFEAYLRGVPVAEALANALVPHVLALRRVLGVEAWEESSLCVTDRQGNRVSFPLSDPDARRTHLV